VTLVLEDQTQDTVLWPARNIFGWTRGVSGCPSASAAKPRPPKATPQSSTDPLTAQLLALNDQSGQTNSSSGGSTPTDDALTAYLTGGSSTGDAGRASTPSAAAANGMDMAALVSGADKFREEERERKRIEALRRKKEEEFRKKQEALRKKQEAEKRRIAKLEQDREDERERREKLARQRERAARKKRTALAILAGVRAVASAVHEAKTWNPNTGNFGTTLGGYDIPAGTDMDDFYDGEVESSQQRIEKLLRQQRQLKAQRSEAMGDFDSQIARVGRGTGSSGGSNAGASNPWAGNPLAKSLFGPQSMDIDDPLNPNNPINRRRQNQTQEAMDAYYAQQSGGGGGSSTSSGFPGSTPGYGGGSSNLGGSRSGSSGGSASGGRSTSRGNRSSQSSSSRFDDYASVGVRPSQQDDQGDSPPPRNRPACIVADGYIKKVKEVRGKNCSPSKDSMMVVVRNTAPVTLKVRVCFTPTSGKKWSCKNSTMSPSQLQEFVGCYTTGSYQIDAIDPSSKGTNCMPRDSSTGAPNAPSNSRTCSPGDSPPCW
jgi:hypothetical protein